MNKLLYRFIIYGAIVAYMLLDLNVLHGPMHQWLLSKQGDDLESLQQQGVAALVYGQPIMESQVTYAITDSLYRRGRTLEQISAQERLLLFSHHLERLILEHLLRIKTHHNVKELPPVSPDLLDQAIERSNQQFGDSYERNDALQRQGYLNHELALRIEADMQQTLYLERQINSTPSQDDQRESTIHYTSSPHYKIRHIFLSTNDRNPEEIKQKLSNEVAKLQNSNLTFSQLSDQINEDTRAKSLQGHLGWVTLERLPEGLAKPLANLPLLQPTLLQSEIGWHYLEVLAYQPSKEQTYPEKDIILHLKNRKRQEGLDHYLKHLRIREDPHVTLVWKP